jgi:hypothetical protein
MSNRKPLYSIVRASPPTNYLIDDETDGPFDSERRRQTS